ncbi:MAG TPA: hypothetical protein GXX47_02510 [Firmicutes bacterium]|nr:hypothetical protein [Bacillota bacterium]
MSLQTKWQDLYQAALDKSFSALETIPGVILGFHSTIDGLKRVVPEQIEKILAANPALEEEVSSRLDTLPTEIRTPADLLVGLASSLQRGKALQLMITEEAVYRWVMDNLGYDQIRMGGTSGNMANFLAPLPLPRILVYANPLTKEQAELFADSENLFVINQDGELQHPHRAWSGEGIYAIHWIFEYPKGLRLKIGGEVLESPRANRFIAAWNPVNNKLQIQASFQQHLPKVLPDFSHFVVSGFHILSENYPDGTTWLDYLRPVARFLRETKNEHSHLRFHYEFASIASPAIRRGIIDHILPTVDSLGLNEVELCAILRDRGEDELAQEVESRTSLLPVLRALERLADSTGLRRIQLHDLGYYLTLVDADYASGEKTRDAMLFAATLAASRSAIGRVGTPDEIREGLNVPTASQLFPLMAELARELHEDKFMETGIAAKNGRRIVLVPTKIVAKPVLTVGLGDLISSSSFILG